MKAKRIVSLLLAVLMLIGMMPVSSLAAMTTTETENLVNYRLMVSDRFGSDNPIPKPSMMGGGTLPITNETDYKNLSMFLGFVVQENPGAAFVEMMDRPFSPEPDDTLDGVEPGDTIYIGLKVKGENLTGGNKGIVNYGAFIKFDGNVFETKSNTLSEFAILNYVSNTEYNKDLTGEELLKYAGAYSLSDRASVTDSIDPGYKLLGVVIQNVGNRKYIPSENTWDIVIPLTVKDGASGSTTIEVVKLDDLSSSEALIGSVEPKTTDISESGTTTVNSNTNDTKMKSNDVTINIEGPAITAAPTTVGTADGQQITVTASNAKFDTTGAAVEANWELTGATSGGASVDPTEVIVDPDGETATLTLPALDNTQNGGVLTIKATSAALEGGTPAAGLTTTINVKAAPTAEFNYSSLSVETDETSNVKFKVKGEEGWSAPFSSSTSGGVKLTDTQLAALNALVGDDETVSDAIIVAWEGAETITSNISITKGAAPTDLAINYTNEQTTATVPNTVEFKVGNGSYETANGSEIKFAGKNAFGQTITYRTKATVSALASNEKTLDVPAKPVVNVTDITTAQEKKEGKSNFTVSTTPADLTVYYKLDSSPVTDAANLGSNEWENGKTGPITARNNNTDKVYFGVKSGVSNFSSEVVRIDPAGNNYGTVELVEAPTAQSTEVKLKITGDEWNTGNISNIDVQNSESSSIKDSGTPVSESDGVVTVTLNGAIGEGTGFKVIVPDNATNLNEAPNNGENPTLTFDVSDNGYFVKMGTSSHEGEDSESDATFDPSGKIENEGTFEVNVTGLKDYEELTADSFTLTADDGSDAGTIAFDADSSKWIYTAPEGTLGESKKITVTVDIDTGIKVKEINLNDLEVTVDTKDYDGTTDLPSGAAVQVKAASKYSDGHNTVDLIYTDAAFASADYNASGVAFDLSGVTIDPSSTDAAYYTLDTANGEVKGTINKVAMNGAIATAEYSGTSVTMDNLIAAFKAGVIEITTADGTMPEVTVEDWLTDTTPEDEITRLIQAAMASSPDEEELRGDMVVGADVTYNASTTATVPVTVTQNATLKPATPAAGIVTYAFGGEYEGFTLDPATGEISVSETAESNANVVVIGKDADEADIVTITLNVTVNAGTYTYDIANLTAGKSITLNFADIKSALDITKATNYSAFPTAVTMTMDVEKKTSGGGGIVGNLVSYEVGENGTIVTGSSSEYVNTGDKPAAVPTVEAKSGYTFLGWSLDKETIVDPATVVINENTTFYAMYQKGYINGYEDGLFYPARNVTRAEFVKMLVMATGLYDGSKTYAATDLNDDKGKWYTNYIACAVEAGIVDGYEDGNFYPDRTITRQEAAKMVYVAMGDVTEATTTDKITDFDTVSNWAKTYVASLVEADIITGYEDGTFQPKRLISRAETTTMIDRVAGFDPTDDEKAEIAANVAPTFEDVTPDSWAYAYIMFASGELDDSYYA